MKIHDIVIYGERLLEEAGIAEYKNDAFLLFENIFQMNRTQYFMNMNKDTDSIEQFEEKYEKYLHQLEQRGRHIPLQHITGHQEFMGLDFLVNEHVLIPRQDTEILVENALKEVKQYALNAEKKEICALDMCTGSGCIAISVKKLAMELYHVDQLSVMAVDLSEAALQTAKKNSEQNHCEIQFLQSDLFTNIKEEVFDIIISNPPYIRSDVIPTLMKEVKEFEPMMALDGDADGLKFYEKITKSAVNALSEEGVLLYEIGYDQGREVSEILKKNGFVDVKVIKDYAGLDRVVTGRKR